MTNKFYKTGSSISLILLMLFTIYYLVIDPMIGSNLMNKKSKYAISNGRLLYIGGRGASSRYYFTINGKIYVGNTRMNGFLQYHYYFVRFYPDNPNYNSLEKKEAFWYDIKGMPVSGFDSIPALK